MWLNPPLTTMEYFMYFRFVNDVILAIISQAKVRPVGIYSVGV